MSEQTLLNDMAILGLPATKKVYYGGNNKLEGIIDIIGTDLNEKEIEKLKKVFRHSIKTRKVVLELIDGGIIREGIREEMVFYFSPTISKYHNLTVCSSSKDELWEMFKADHTGQTIPARKCFFKLI